MYTSKNCYHTIYLGKSDSPLAKGFEAYCLAKGKKPNILIKDAIERVLRKHRLIERGKLNERKVKFIFDTMKHANEEIQQKIFSPKRKIEIIHVPLLNEIEEDVPALNTF